MREEARPPGESRRRPAPWCSRGKDDRHRGYAAAEDLVTELLRTSLTLQDLFVDLVEEIPEDAFPGEDPGLVLLEMISGSACQAARAAGDERCREASALIGAIRDRVIDDLRRAAELSRRRGE